MKLLTKILLLATLGTVNLNAQNDTNAENLLNEVSTKIQSYKNIDIEFNYALTNTVENIKEEINGTVTLQGNKYKLNLYGITRLYDGEKMYTISPDDEEVTISKEFEDEEDSISPNKMLTFYKKGYNYKMDIIQNIQGRKIQYVKLIPTDSTSDVKSILLGIDTNTKHIYNLIEISKNNTHTTLTVNSLKTNQDLSENYFNFNKNKYEDYFINNLN